jgi:effector-binding domain-containing protein
VSDSGPDRAGGAEPEPSVRDRAAQPTVAVRVRQPMATLDIAALMARHLPEVTAAIASSGRGVAGPSFLRTHEWGDTVDLELGYPVDGPAKALAPLVAAVEPAPGRSSLPGGQCAVLVHVGSYARLGRAHARLAAWIDEQGLVPDGASWESYVDDPRAVPREEVRTELVQPVRATGG